MNKAAKTAGDVFVTLGPSGTNHELVTRNYLAFRSLKSATIKLVGDFYLGLKMISDGSADFMIQVAVHPDCADVVAAAHFEHDIHVVDTFISPSQDLAILTRKDVKTPQILALQPATKKYAKLDQWRKLVSVSSIMQVAEGLLEGKYDSGLTTLEVAQRYPDRLRVDAVLGSVDDPWLVYGKRRVSDGELVAWPESPVIHQFV